MSLNKAVPGFTLPIRTDTPSSVRAVNRSIMLQLIRCRQPVSRADLARLTGIFRSSVSDIVDELIEDNLVAEQRAVPSQRGRVPMSLRLNDAGYPVVGLNIRPAYCHIARAGLNGRIHKSLTFQTPASPKKLVQAAVDAGAGAVLNGEMYLGHNANFAAEAGHMIVEPAPAAETA